MKTTSFVVVVPGVGRAGDTWMRARECGSVTRKLSQAWRSTSKENADAFCDRVGGIVTAIGVAK